MKRPDNQINALFIDILRIKWLVFFISSAQLDRWQATSYYQPAPGRTNSIPERHQRQWIYYPSELIHWRQCLLSWATEPCPLRLRETLACICGMLTWLPAKLAKNGMHVNPFTSGLLYFFRTPQTGLFSVKILKKFLAIKKFLCQWYDVRTTK